MYVKKQQHSIKIGRADPYISITGLSMGDLRSNSHVKEVSIAIPYMLIEHFKISLSHHRLRYTDFYTASCRVYDIDGNGDCDTDYKEVDHD